MNVCLRDAVECWIEFSMFCMHVYSVLRESRGDVREISMFYAIKISPIAIFSKEKIDNDY